MTFVEHLTELRDRLKWVFAYVIIAFFASYHFGDEIASILLRPLRETLGDDGKIVVLNILDNLLAKFQLSLWSALLIASPLWFWEFWKFIKPGLYEKEIKIVRPFIIIGFTFFVLGVCFGYFLVFPFTFEVLMQFGISDLQATISYKDYLILSVKVLIFLGLMFQLPNLMLILGFMGIVTKPLLSRIRPYVIVCFAVLSAVLTPPDPFTLMCMLIPLTLLFEIGNFLIGLIVHPYQKKQHIPSEET